MNKFKRMECLSGGYCGKIFVTDITRFKADNLTQNGKYDAGNAISSVSWNPGLSIPTHSHTHTHLHKLHILFAKKMYIKFDCLQLLSGFATMASAVSDAGELHFFDTRIGQHDRKNLVIRSGWKQLNTHVMSPGHSLFVVVSRPYLIHIVRCKKFTQCLIWI